MRYYEITLTPKGSTTPIRTWSSYPGGVYDPGALDVEFDMPVTTYGAPAGGQTISVHGISLADLTQSQQFAGMNMIFKAGMQAGLPLVTPSQAGTIIAGDIFQSFGNWQGTDMTLDFVLNPAIYTNDTPGNFTLVWNKGERLSDSLTHCLQVALPNMPISMNISPSLVLSNDGHHYCKTLDQLAQYIDDLTDRKFKGNRVNISIQGGKLVIFDNTYTPNPIQINFNDLIGQPTWIDVQTLQIKTVMRADLQLGARITMPTGFQNAPGFVAINPASFPSSLKYKSTFSGNFTIIELRHIGSYRSSDATNWCTLFNCVPI